MPVHQKKVTILKEATALPIGKRSAPVISFEGLPHLDSIYGYLIPDTADGLTGKRQHALHERQPTR